MHPMDPKETKIRKRLRRQGVISKALSNDCIEEVNQISSCLYCRQSTFINRIGAVELSLFT